MNRSLLPLAVIALALPAAAQAQAQYKLLVLARPSTYHYEYIPIARDSLERLAKLHAFELVFTNKTNVFEGDLSQYAAIMFLNTAGSELNAAQRRRFEAYMRAGGNAMIVHRAAIMPANDWPWYEKLVGRTVGVHPMLQTGVVTIVDRGFPATYGLPERWLWSDEFYVTSNPYRITIDPVLNVDESSYDPRKIWPGQMSHPMGRDHPIAWHHRFEQGRVFVTTLGHNGEMYRDPQYLAHLMGGIHWTATGRGQRP
ncbi:ThuA domain-containing protein [Sphingomonas sp. KR1UV-12]|uniref:ThuA domain-containing protein n=1 Tax=Sphingomonas aurea TaxID=3063994 RepID=A0ABT9EK25_9SPHN|nr:ThuA domain-containing protein [Sphingomonas sp. KR1UV-12]MDP1027330.1 ThuA domain-containing protein [Sphingomonas sp. KR1UV-12]